MLVSVPLCVPQLYVSPWWSGFHYPGSDPLCWHAKAQSDDAPTHRLLGTICLFLVLLDIYEDEITRLPAQLEN